MHPVYFMCTLRVHYVYILYTSCVHYVYICTTGCDILCRFPHFFDWRMISLLLWMVLVSLLLFILFAPFLGWRWLRTISWLYVFHGIANLTFDSFSPLFIISGLFSANYPFIHIYNPSLLYSDIYVCLFGAGIAIRKIR